MSFEAQSRSNSERKSHHDDCLARHIRDDHLFNKTVTEGPVDHFNQGLEDPNMWQNLILDKNAYDFFFDQEEGWKQGELQRKEVPPLFCAREEKAITPYPQSVSKEEVNSQSFTTGDAVKSYQSKNSDICPLEGKASECLKSGTGDDHLQQKSLNNRFRAIEETLVDTLKSQRTIEKKIQTTDRSGFV